MKSILNILLALMVMTGLMMQSAQAANILYFNDSPGKEDFMGNCPGEFKRGVLGHDRR